MRTVGSEMGVGGEEGLGGGGGGKRRGGALIFIKCP